MYRSVLTCDINGTRVLRGNWTWWRLAMRSELSGKPINVNPPYSYVWTALPLATNSARIRLDFPLQVRFLLFQKRLDDKKNSWECFNNGTRKSSSYWFKRILTLRFISSNPSAIICISLHTVVCHAECPGNDDLPTWPIRDLVELPKWFRTWQHKLSVCIIVK